MACAAHEAQPVADQELPAERAEQDQPLHDADEARWEVGSLQCEARVLQPAEQERDEADSERVVARERGDDDAGVAIRRRREAARIERVSEVAVLARPADARAPAAEPHHREALAPRAQAAARPGAGG